MKKLTHIPSLDGVRAIAVLMVIVFHYFSNIPSVASRAKTYTSWWWAGVDLFFVLSGFLIGRILINSRESKSYFRTFYARRFFRIFPAYYFIIGLFLFVSAIDLFPTLTEVEHPLYAYVLYIQNFFQGATGDFGTRWFTVTWSLAVEEQFYMILPLLIFILPKRHIPFLCFTGIIAAPIFRYVLADLNAYVLLPSRMDGLFIGVLIAYYHLKEKTNFSQMLLAVVSLALLATIQILVNRTGFETPGQTLNHSLLSIFFGCVVMLAINARGAVQRVFTFRPMVFIGKISYMMYLTHQIFNGIFHEIFKGGSPTMYDARDFVITGIALMTCIIFCSFSFQYFEKPILRLGQRYTYDEDSALPKINEIPLAKSI